MLAWANSEQHIPGSRQNALRIDIPQLYGYARTVRTRTDPQRSVLLGDIIQMNTNSRHSFEHLDRRLDMRHPGFYRRLGERCAAEPIVAHGNGQILVPGQSPGILRRLVE